MNTYTPTELAELFAKIERDLAAARHGEELEHVLVHTAADLVPGAAQAGLSVGRYGKYRTTAATADVVRQIDAIQYRLGEGPCVDAIVEDTVFNVGDLRTDPRWPAFGRAAVEETEIRSMLSFRLYLENDAEIVAGLNLYSPEPAAFDDSSETVGTLLATHGALAISSVTAREKATNLMTALKSSREIGIAMGVLMTRYRITRDQAFDLLRVASQQTHRKVAVLATEVADTGELPVAPQRRGSADAGGSPRP